MRAALGLGERSKGKAAAPAASWRAEEVAAGVLLATARFGSGEHRCPVLPC